MRKSQRILLTGGGSGGHIIPNLAVVSAIKNKHPDAELLYIASRKKLDADLLKKANIPFKQIFSGKLRRYFSWQNFIDPLFVLMGFFQSLIILLHFRPQVVFSKGGYVSLPVVLAAFLLRQKIILHESDSRMGLANRLASKLATVVCVSFPELKKRGKKYKLTGNPVRAEIAQGNLQKGCQLTGFNKKLPIILVWGGSQGAAQINDLILRDFDRFIQYFQIIHITGANKSIRKKHPHYIAFEYLDEDLKHIYTITDLIIGRAGANSLYEVAYLKKPNIILPLGNSDQLGNARYFEETGASLVYKQEDRLFDITHDLWQNKALQKKMREALSKISKKDASEKIATLIINS